MKPKFLVALASLIILGGLVFIFTKPNDQKTTQTTQKTEGEVVLTIEMRGDKYEPNTGNIKAGQAVKFINKSNVDMWPASNVHPTHDIYSEFDPKRGLKPGEEWIFTFDKVGEWRMHDHLVPFIKGSITVEAL